MRIPSQWHTWKSLILAMASVCAILLASSVGSLGIGVANASADSGPKPLPAGTHVHVASCVQAPAQSVKDRATYTPSELAQYGLPPRTPGEPFAKWAQIVRGAGQRVCDFTVGSGQWSESNTYNYAGNYADQATPGQVYSEADMDFFVSCISSATPPNDPFAADPSHPTTAYGAWIGLGGIQGAKHLVQAGIAGFKTYNGSSWQTSYTVFVEDTQNDSGPRNIFAVNCGDHIYAKVWDSGTAGCMYVQRISDGKNTGNQCYGKHSDELTAEAIAERSFLLADELANFSPVTFYGVGITDNQNYEAMSSVPHDYFNMNGCVPYYQSPPSCNGYGNQLVSTGPIQNDPGDVPYDQYTMTWHNYY